MSAWKEVSAAAGSGKVVVPKGKYFLGVVDLIGPCKGAMHLQVEGTLVAPAKASQHSKNSWVTLRYLDRLTVSGGGAFDGQGEIAWERAHCGDRCKTPLPIVSKTECYFTKQQPFIDPFMAAILIMFSLRNCCIKTVPEPTV